MPLSSGLDIKIGAIGFEPTTSSTPSWRAKPLRHAPMSHYTYTLYCVKPTLPVLLAVVWCPADFAGFRKRNPNEYWPNEFVDDRRDNDR
jgi:hypothetical protein